MSFPSLLSILLLVLSLPPFNLPLIPFALAPLILASLIGSKKSVFFWSLIVGFVYFMFVLWPLTSLESWWWTNESSYLWIYREYIIYGSVAILSLFGSLSTFVPFCLLIKNGKEIEWHHYLILPLFWVGLEIVRTFVVMGFGWGTLGYLLHKPHSILLLTPWITVYGLSFLIIVVNVFVAEILLKKFVEWPTDIYVKGKFFAVILVIALCIFFGNTEQKKLNAIEKKGEIEIALLSPNLSSIETTTSVGATTYFSLLAETLEYSPDIVTLPENTFPFFSIDETSKEIVASTEDAKLIANDLILFSKTTPDTSYIFGVRTQKEEERFNSVVVLENGKFVDIYNKQKLLPFAEQSPEKLSSIHIEPLSTKSGDSVVKTKFGDIDVRICSEIYFQTPNTHSESLFLAHISNDAMFQSSAIHDWSHIFSTFRAIENKKIVVRAVKGGDSEFIGVDGRPLIFEKKREGLVIGKVPLF